MLRKQNYIHLRTSSVCVKYYFFRVLAMGGLDDRRVHMSKTIYALAVERSAWAAHLMTGGVALLN